MHKAFHLVNRFLLKLLSSNSILQKPDRNLMPAFIIRALTPADSDWVSQVMISEWSGEMVVAHGEIFYPAILPGFAAFVDAEPVGLLTYNIAGDECEIITLNSWRENLGVGTALISTARRVADQAGCSRLLLVTTNNNLHALQFYKKRGFVISSVRENAISGSRKLKPQIPLLDNDGQPISDEIEMEIWLK
jgi:ribosomal protein S18 acetylase RimI-like enzyme